MRFGTIILAVATLIAVSSHAWANGAARGGGNGEVCFAKNSPWPKRLKVSAGDWHDQDSYVPTEGAHYIPDEALNDIISIEMLDYAETKGNNHKNVVEPLHKLPPISLEQWSTQHGQIVNLFEQEFQRFADRYKDAVPKIYKDLMRAHDAITFDTLELAGKDDRLDQINDFTEFKTADNCMMTTIINQNVNTGDKPTSWTIDGRLFFHPKHSFISQNVAVFHERAYWLDRQHAFWWSKASSIYFFVNRTIGTETTYIEAIRQYSNIFWNDTSTQLLTMLDSGPVIWFKQFWQNMSNATGLAAPQYHDLARPYHDRFRAELMNLSYIDDKTKSVADKNIERYIRTGDWHLIEPSGLWPADFELTLLPDPDFKK